MLHGLITWVWGNNGVYRGLLFISFIEVFFSRMGLVRLFTFRFFRKVVPTQKKGASTVVI